MLNPTEITNVTEIFLKILFFLLDLLKCVRSSEHAVCKLVNMKLSADGHEGGSNTDSALEATGLNQLINSFSTSSTIS